MRSLVLEAVRTPEVDRARALELLAHVLGDLETLDAVVDPELADLRIRRGERQAVHDVRVREEGRVEVKAVAVLLRPRDPRLELLDAELVAVDDLILVNAVAGVEVHAVLARNELHREVDVGHELVRRRRLARIVARRLNAVRRAAHGLESADVIALPAMHGDGDLAEVLDDLLGVDADLRELLLRFLVAHNFLSDE